MTSIKERRWLIAALSFAAIVGASCSSNANVEGGAAPAPETSATTNDAAQSSDGESETNQDGGGESFELVASDGAFDTDRLELPADTEIELTFRNTAGSDIPHNLAIYNDGSAGEEIFVGERVSGGQDITYTLPATPAGEYYFRCDVHPSMEGTVVFG